MIPFRLYIYAAAALAIAGLLWHDHYVAGLLKSARTENTTLKATILAERENLRKADEASKAYQADLSRLESERGNVPVVRLCKRTPALPDSTTPAGPDAAATGHVGEAPASDPGPDIGPQLLEYGIACEANALQLDRLQKWIRGR